MNSVETNLLRHADALLNDAAADVLPQADLTDARLTVLETVASNIAGWDLCGYRELTCSSKKQVPDDAVWAWAEKVYSAISETEIPAPLALSALAREVLPSRQQRTTGAYYTDWRLARMLANDAVPRVTADGIWVDPACGTGILLAAAALAVPEGARRDSVIGQKLAGADLSRRALRGALLAVASLTSNLDAVAGFASRLLTQDSLRSPEAWTNLAPCGAALVIGNPPWEKLRTSRHELGQSLGQDRHYGQSYAVEPDVTRSRRGLLEYLNQVTSGTRLQGKGEHDLYKLFLELGIGLSSDDGILAILVPAGLIRAQGTEPLRREIDQVSTELAISVVENRARHFAIDTRFKFLALTARIGQGDREPLQLRVADRTGALPAEPVIITRDDLHWVRPDLTVPEVRTSREWELFQRLTRSAVTLADPFGPWRADYRREVDMTLDRNKFVRGPGPQTVPVLEGRHVTQYRWRAKSYVCGEGRAAIWSPEPLDRAATRTQWHIEIENLRRDTRTRIEASRVGFCDITGQTNERSFLVARIPAGVVCGNKVPTLVFEDGLARADLFIAVANSLVVDWVLRRLVTTTVNYFLLKTLPLPTIVETTEVGRQLVALSRKIQRAEGDPKSSLWQIGQWRGQVDALIAHTWGLDLEDMRIVLDDFPLLDRGQPSLPGETRSTITADVVLSLLAKIQGVPHPARIRVVDARRLGALPYIPAEYA